MCILKKTGRLAEAVLFSAALHMAESEYAIRHNDEKKRGDALAAQAAHRVVAKGVELVVFARSAARHTGLFFRTECDRVPRPVPPARGIFPDQPSCHAYAAIGRQSNTQGGRPKG